MTDFSKILNKAKELEAKMKESQEKIKSIQIKKTKGSAPSLGTARTGARPPLKSKIVKPK